MPLKIRPGNINIHRVGGGGLASSNSNNVSIISTELDIQGKSVVNK